MSQLAQLQADFQACIINEDSQTFKTCVIDDAIIGADKRLKIYADAYRLRIIEAPATTYPKLNMLLGDDFFDETARQYIDLYPSTYRNMRWVGNQMAEHLRTILPQHPIAAELAAFEWALGLALMLKMHLYYRYKTWRLSGRKHGGSVLHFTLPYSY